MKIDFENEFLVYVLSRGYEYYTDNRVSDVTINDDIVSATVNGNDEYKVTLEIEDNMFFDGECSCPYFESNGYCKHMAAVLYYLNDFDFNNENNKYNLEDIVNNVAEKDVRNFLYNSIINDADLLNRFRIEFSDYFPKLSKDNYRDKIEQAIIGCYDRYGFIDYRNANNYEHVMFEFINEARKLVDSRDYETAFTIVSIILDTIPDTNIDDSNGSTGMVAENSIEIIFDILDAIHDETNPLLKSILDYVMEEVKTTYLYNYGIDLQQILKYFIDEKWYLDKIKVALEEALDSSSDKSYFYNRVDYVEYLIEIYELKGETDNIIKILEKHSYDSDVLLKYVDELIKNNKLKDAINILTKRLDDKDYKSRSYANKLAEIYLTNNRMDEYKDILYQMFYKFDKYDIDIYRKMKKLYSSKDWDIEKNKIIENIKKDTFCDRDLNNVLIEEKMYDELYFNVCNHSMEYVQAYEKYLLPKYNDELLNIYMKSCLKDAQDSGSRNKYRDLARKVNYIIGMDNSNEIVKLILKEMNEKYFCNRPAMLDEFKNIIKNLNEYIE